MPENVVNLNPDDISFKTLLKCEKAFGIRVLPLMKKLERASRSTGGFDIDDLSMEELMTLTMLALDVRGNKEITADDILDMSVSTLKDSLTGLVDAPVMDQDPS